MEGGVFEGLVKIHTNPTGVFTATALHKVIMNSKSNGALRDVFRSGNSEACLELVNNFYRAVRTVFEDDWFQKDTNGRVIGLHSARSSRLVHSAGITALGHIMDAAFTLCEAETEGQFVDVLKLLKPRCAWTSALGLLSQCLNIGRKFKIPGYRPVARISLLRLKPRIIIKAN